MRDVVIVDNNHGVCAEYVILKRIKGKLLIAEIRPGLHSYRMKAGLSQGHMAIKLGLSQGGYSKMESGDLNTPDDILLKAQEILSKAAKPGPKPQRPKPQRNGRKR